MKALHAGTCSADTAVWTRARVIRRHRRIAFGGIPCVCFGDASRIDLGLRATHAAASLEATHLEHLIPSDEPVPRRHGLTIVEQRSVAHDDGRSRGITDDDLERTARRSADEASNGRDVVAHVRQ
jgi:hypothetical protein